jgi:hypothetical protein
MIRDPGRRASMLHVLLTGICTDRVDITRALAWSPVG